MLELAAGDLSILVAPLAAGVVVLASHARLGEAVLARGIVFIDLAIAQLAALGTMLASTVTHEHGTPGPASVAAGTACALIGALAIAGLGRRFAAWREALIGLVYAGAAVTGVLVASADPEGHHALSRMLAGDVLWTGWRDLLPIAVATLAWFALRRLAGGRANGDALFYPAFAILVSLSVPLLGVYLVFASLIVPAIVRAAHPGFPPAATVVLAAVAWAVGLGASLLADAPSGPCVVVALLVLVAVALATARRSKTAA